jgi:hypothetical protein
VPAREPAGVRDPRDFSRDRTQFSRTEGVLSATGRGD